MGEKGRNNNELSIKYWLVISEAKEQCSKKYKYFDFFTREGFFLKSDIIFAFKFQEKLVLTIFFLPIPSSNSTLMVDPMSEEHIYVTRGFSLNIPSSSHEGEFRWSCLPTFEAGGPERSPRVKDPLLLPGRSLKKMNIYLLLFFFPWSWLIIWRVFTNQFHVKKFRDKNKINLCTYSPIKWRCWYYFSPCVPSNDSIVICSWRHISKKTFFRQEVLNSN